MPLLAMRGGMKHNNNIAVAIPPFFVFVFAFLTTGTLIIGCCNSFPLVKNYNSLSPPAGYTTVARIILKKNNYNSKTKINHLRYRQNSFTRFLSLSSSAIFMSPSASSSSDEQQKQTTAGTCTAVSSTSATTLSKSFPGTSCNTNNNNNNVRTIRVLGLHGSGGNGKQFATNVLQNWNDYFRTNNNNNLNMDITTITAPVLTVDNDDDDNKGYAWWSMSPPGTRSFNATVYESFDTSEELVVQTIQQKSTAEPYDIMIGHSQGAILITALLALNKIPKHPKLGYILNGVAMPNPYRQQLDSLQVASTTSTVTPNILFIIGEQDQMNPPEQAYSVSNALTKAGYNITIVQHARGHSVPIARQTGEDPTLEKIQNWIVQLYDTKS